MKRKNRVVIRALLCFVILAAVFALPAAAMDITDPSDIVDLTEDGTFPLSMVEDLGATTTVEIMVLLTVLTLVPSILIMVTGFTRIAIVLSFTRNAMGTQQTPPNQVIIGLSLFLTFMVMQPVFAEMQANAWDPYQAGEIEIGEALDNAVDPLRKFMGDQILINKNESSINNFMYLAGLPDAATIDDVPTYVLIPAFITSEIKTAFQIGFIIFLPFIAIDMIVASALMSMGMMMLPPVMISLPFKIMVFVLVDGWNLTIGTLLRTFSP